MRQHRSAIVAVLAAASVGLAYASTAQRHPDEAMEITGAIDRLSVERLVADWPESARKAARQMLERYGAPIETTPTLLLWNDVGPWKRVVVRRAEQVHLFPNLHADVLEQTVSYRVPVEKFDDLARLDGSLIADRTKGELTARGDLEETNFLAVNLAHDLIAGRTTVEKARRFYAKASFAAAAGKSSGYQGGLRFTPDRTQAGDPDMPLIEKLLEH